MDDQKLARLLSGRDEPSVIEKEALLGRVLAETRTSKRRRFAGWLFAATLSAAGAAAVVVAMRPTAPDEFQARGPQAMLQPRVELVCVETGKVGSCRAHGTLAFNVQTEKPDTYFAAFALRDRALTWFFPREGAVSTPVSSRGEPAPFGEGVRLGKNMSAGSYEVFAVFSRVPLSRDEIKEQLGDDLRGHAELRVVRRTLLVEPEQ